MQTLTLNFNDFKHTIRTRLEERETRILENPGYRAAAVLILFIEIDSEPCILVTRRTHKVSTHKGEMSLPGGGYDETDTDILETALRETHEETGIPPEDIEILGRFDDYISIFGFHVAVFAGAADYPCSYNFNSDEISGYVEAPFRLFAERRYDRVQHYPHEGKNYRIYHYMYNGYEIWGLTARILTDFAEELIENYENNQ